MEEKPFSLTLDLTSTSRKFDQSLGMGYHFTAYCLYEAMRITLTGKLQARIFDVYTKVRLAPKTPGRYGKVCTEWDYDIDPKRISVWDMLTTPTKEEPGYTLGFNANYTLPGTKDDKVWEFAFFVEAPVGNAPPEQTFRAIEKLQDQLLELFKNPLTFTLVK